MAIRAKAQGWQFAALLVAALLLWGIERWKPGLLRQLGDRQAETVGAYERFDGCVWVEHRQNDGDSFRLKLPDGRVEQFRLYFADAPESAFRTYGGGRNNHDRIRDQALDMGLDETGAVEVGKEAKERVKRLLSGGGVTIFTEWDDPFGDRRFHAFVLTPDGWLHEWLIAEGFARLHTSGASLPDGTSERDQEEKLFRLEQLAKTRR